MKYDTALFRIKSQESRIRNFIFSIRNWKLPVPEWGEIGNSRKSEHGFTLIELLIVISIIGMLVGLSVAAYSTFNKNQSYNNAVNDLVNMLQVARSRAISQYAPSQYCGSGSPNLLYYQVNVITTPTPAISLQIWCNGSLTTPIQTIQVTNASFSSAQTIKFQVGTGNTGAVTQFDVTGNGSKHIKVDTNGLVTVN